MITQLVNRLSKVRGSVGRFFQPADYFELMNNGRYFLEAKRPDIAQESFMSAISQQPNSADAWYLYAVSLLDQDRMKLQRLDERVWFYENGQTYRDEVRKAHQKVAELGQNAESYFNAFLLAHEMRELKIAKSYLGKAIESEPDNHLLIKIGRVTTTLMLADLTERVRALLNQRELAVNLYPIQ